MKKIFVGFLLAAVAFSASAQLQIGTLRLSKVPYNRYEGEVILTMKDGSTRRGWNRTEMLPGMGSVEISATRKGDPERIVASQIERLTFLPSTDERVHAPADTVRFVRLTGFVESPATKQWAPDAESKWLREEFVTPRMGVYSHFLETKVPNAKGKQTRYAYYQVYYLRVGDGPLVKCAEPELGKEQKEGPTLRNTGMENGVRGYLLAALRDYPALCERIRNYGFANMAEVFAALDEELK